MKAYISPHWFKFTIPKDLTDLELDSICLELFSHPFTDFYRSYKGRDGYRDRNTLSELVSVMRNGYLRNAGTTCFDISGTGLDTLGLDIATLGKFALDNGGNICRVDIAALDTGNHIPYDQLLDCCTGPNFKRRVRTKFNRGKDQLPDIRTQPVRRIIFGSEKSDNYCVMYDRQQAEKLDFSCINIEQRITNRADCRAIVEALLSGVPEGEYFASLLKGKLDFLQDVPGKKQFKPSETWWQTFLGGVAACRIKRTKRDKSAWLHQGSPATLAGKWINKIANPDDLTAIAAQLQECSSRLGATDNTTAEPIPPTPVLDFAPGIWFD